MGKKSEGINSHFHGRGARGSLLASFACLLALNSSLFAPCLFSCNPQHERRVRFPLGLKIDGASTYSFPLFPLMSVDGGVVIRGLSLAFLFLFLLVDRVPHSDVGVAWLEGFGGVVQGR